MIGGVLGVLTVAAAWLAYGDAQLAWAVGVSIAAAGVTACAVGLSLPWALSHAGLDPAFGSGPVATVIQDLLSLLIYFWVVSIVLV
jgi:magnesium transporter